MLGLPGAGLKYLYVDASTNSIAICTAWPQDSPGFNLALIELESRFGAGMFTLYPEAVKDSNSIDYVWLRLGEITPLVLADPSHAGTYAGETVDEPDFPYLGT